MPLPLPTCSKRTILVFAAAAIALATLAASHWGVVRFSDGSRWSLFIGAGRLGLEVYAAEASGADLTPAPGFALWRFTNDADAGWPDTQNTSEWLTSDTTLSWLSRWSIPLWPIVPVLIGLSIWALTRERRRSRSRAGACIHCGYSLTGLAPGAPCPECGKPGNPQAHQPAQSQPATPANQPA